MIVDLEHSSKDYAAELKKKIDDRLYKFIVSENYEAVFSISVGVVDAVTFCEGYEECRKKFAFVLKKAKKMGKNGFYIFDDNDYESFLRTGKIVAAPVSYTHLNSALILLDKLPSSSFLLYGIRSA